MYGVNLDLNNCQIYETHGTYNVIVSEKLPYILIDAIAIISCIHLH